MLLNKSPATDTNCRPCKNEIKKQRKTEINNCQLLQTRQNAFINFW